MDPMTRRTPMKRRPAGIPAHGGLSSARGGLTIVLSISFTVLPGPAMAGDGQWTGLTQCFINGRWVTVRGNCPSSGGGGGASSGSGGGAGAAGGLYGGFYSLGYA